MVYGYIRISSNSQKWNNSFEVQESIILEKFPKAKIIKEQHTATTERPIFRELVSKLKRGDKLVCTEVDRLTRNTIEGIQLYDLMVEKGFVIYIISIGEIGKNAYGRFSFINSVSLAEYEHSKIWERTYGGKKIAKKSEEYKEGRPRVFSEDEISEALELLSTHSYNAVERITGISKSTLVRAKREEKNKQENVLQKEIQKNTKPQTTFVDKKTFYLNYERLLFSLTLLKTYDVELVAQRYNINVKLLKNIKSLFDKQDDAFTSKNIVSGKYSLPNGRPVQYNSGEIFEAMLMLKNYSYREVERITGISKSTLTRAKRKINAEINNFMTN